MEMLKGACVVGQSGGPTSVINASVLGVVQAAMQSEAITQVLGALNGISGILEDRLIDFGLEDPEELEQLRYTPSSVLGSCRYKLANPEEDDTDYQRILEVFRKYNVRYFFYNGGNDSMDTCNKVSAYLSKAGYQCRVIGVPKTIDNDLVGTDHCPGYGSAAKFIATVCAELQQDTQVYTTPTVNILEIMGRHAGWLAGAAGLASVAGQGPDLIYLPERDFSMEEFLEDVTAILNAKGHCVVAVSEGIHDSAGHFLNQVETAAADGFGHVQLGGLGGYLADVVKKRLSCKARGIELSLLQRCAAHIAAQTDIDESYNAGKAAVETAVRGISGVMIGFERSKAGADGAYHCLPVAVDLQLVANAEKKVPLTWINARGNQVTQDFIDYALPLIQGETKQQRISALPRYAKLKKVLTTGASAEFEA